VLLSGPRRENPPTRPLCAMRGGVGANYLDRCRRGGDVASCWSVASSARRNPSVSFCSNLMQMNNVVRVSLKVRKDPIGYSRLLLSHNTTQSTLSNIPSISRIYSFFFQWFTAKGRF
jgi:hypothetical protein